MHEILSLLDRYGVALVFLNVLAEQLGLPLPAVPTLIVAGALAADGKLPTLPLALSALAGSLIGDLVWYYAGKRYGHKVLGTLCRISLSPDSCVKQTERFFDRWGFRALTFAKFIPGFSTVAPPLAGATPRARLSLFLLYDTIGIVLWAGGAMLAGALFHRAIDRLLLNLENLGFWSLLILGGLLLLFLAGKWWERQRFYKALRMARVAPEEVLEMIDRGIEPLVADVRSHHSRLADPYIIPGALMLDVAHLDEQMAALPRNRDIILYCT